MLKPSDMNLTLAQTLTVVKVELVELDSFDQVPQRLWLEARHGRIA